MPRHQRQMLASSVRLPFTNGRARNAHVPRPTTVASAASEAAEASEAPAHKDASEWYAHMKAEFDPISSAPPTTAVLDFEKPLVELDRRIREVRSVVDPIAAAGRPSSSASSSFHTRSYMIFDV